MDASCLSAALLETNHHHRPESPVPIRNTPDQQPDPGHLIHVICEADVWPGGQSRHRTVSVFWQLLAPILLAMTSPDLVSAEAMSSAQTTPLPNIHHSSPVGSCRTFNCDLRLRLPTKSFSLRSKSSTTTTRRCQDQGKTLASPVCMLEGLSVSSVDHYSKIASSSPLSLGAYLLLSSFRVQSR